MLNLAILWCLVMAVVVGPDDEDILADVCLGGVVPGLAPKCDELCSFIEEGVYYRVVYSCL